MNRREFFCSIAGVPLAGIVAAGAVKKPQTIICYPSKYKQCKTILESQTEMYMRHWGEMAGQAFKHEKEKAALRAWKS